MLTARLEIAWAAYDELREEDCLAVLDELRELAPDDPECRYLEALVRLDRWELGRAQELLERREPDDDWRAPFLYQLAILAEARADVAAAEALYRDAAALDPEGCPLPVRIDDEEARAIAEAVLAALPEEFGAALENVVLEIRDMPDGAVEEMRDSPPTVLGLYLGLPIGEKSSWDGAAMPDRVLVFKRNLERVVDNRAELTEQLRITLLHEIGHHLGFDEDGVDELGLA